MATKNRRPTTFTHFEFEEGEVLCLCDPKKRSKSCTAPNCPPFVRYSKLMGLERLAAARSRKPSESSENPDHGHERLLQWLTEKTTEKTRTHRGYPPRQKVGSPVRDSAVAEILPKGRPVLVDRDGRPLETPEDSNPEIIAEMDLDCVEEPLG